MLKQITGRMVFASITFCVLLASFVLIYPVRFGLCSGVSDGLNPIGPFCYFGVRGVSGLAIFYFSTSLFLTSLVLVFLRKEIFNAWIKFAIWAFPLFVFFSIDAGGPNRGFFIPNEEEFAIILSWTFAIVSLAIIAWKYWRLSKKK